MRRPKLVDFVKRGNPPQWPALDRRVRENPFHAIVSMP